MIRLDGRQTAGISRGTFSETNDNLAYIVIRPRFTHAGFALGYIGNGIALNTIIAEIIRDYFFDQPRRDAHLFRFGR